MMAANKGLHADLVVQRKRAEAMQTLLRKIRKEFESPFVTKDYWYLDILLEIKDLLDAA